MTALITFLATYFLVSLIGVTLWGLIGATARLHSQHVDDQASDADR